MIDNETFCEMERIAIETGYNQYLIEQKDGTRAIKDYNALKKQTKVVAQAILHYRDNNLTAEIEEFE